MLEPLCPIFDLAATLLPTIMWGECLLPPPPTLPYNQGVPMLVPGITRTPYLWEEDTSPTSRVLVSIGNYKETPHFLGFLRKSSRDYAPKYPPFMRKWKHACCPLMHWEGGWECALGLVRPHPHLILDITFCHNSLSLSFIHSFH